MTPALSVALGLMMTVAGWGAARAVAGAGLNGPVLILMHDGLVPLGTFLVIVMATGRPLLGGAIALGAFGGFAFADKVKRAVLREPIVFTDMSEVVELFRHPQFYLPSAGTGRVIAGAGLALILYAAILVAFRPVFSVSAEWSLSIMVATLALILFWAKGPLGFWARLLRRWRPDGDPVSDARRFGPFAMIGCYGIIARSERQARRAAAPAVGLGIQLAQTPPVVLVQSESFFDVTRLGLGEEMLPAFHAARSTGQWGRLSVPCWGANTTRTEFSVLTGLGQIEAGYDILNPYHAFTDKPVPSLARYFKNRGYRTVCIHPFDLNFYGRRRVLPLLGFDEVIGEGAFAAAAGRRGYVTDAAVADMVAGLLAEKGRPLFVFVISMENHGPWTAGMSVPAIVQAVRSDQDGLGDYLDTLKGADAMIARLTAALEQDGRNGLLGFYGDHMPSLPRAFAALGFEDSDTDYFLWRPRGVGPSRNDIAAEGLPHALLTLLQS
jgi:hypothetical protein